MTFRSLGCLAFLALAGATLPARAASVYLQSVTPSANMVIQFPGTGSFETGYVGAIQWTFDRSDPDNTTLDSILPGTSLTTFCIEGTQDVQINQTTTFANISTNLATLPQDNAGSLYEMGSHAATLQKFWNEYYGQASLNSINAAAFQVGVWEIVYDNNTGLSTGNFQASADPSDPTSVAAFNQAQTWLSDLASVTPTDQYQLYVLSDPNFQDQLFGVKTTSAPPSTPLPAAMPAGVAMGAGLLIIKRWLRR